MVASFLLQWTGTATMALPLWSEYQSIIQLSIGLNAAFASIPSLVTPLVALQRRRIDAELSRLKIAVDDNHALRTSLRQEQKELRAIWSRLRHQDRKFERFTHGILRRLCAAWTLVGIGLLLMSTVRFSSEIAVPSQLACVFLLWPFVLGIGYAAWLSFKIDLDCRRDLKAALLQIDRIL